VALGLFGGRTGPPDPAAARATCCCRCSSPRRWAALSRSRRACPSGSAHRRRRLAFVLLCSPCRPACAVGWPTVGRLVAA
jgi:hypothetical protein